MLVFEINIVEADYPNSNQGNTPYDSVYIEINNGKCEQRSKAGRGLSPLLSFGSL